MRVCESSSPENQRLSNPGKARSAKSGGRPTNSTIDPPIQSNPLQLQCIAGVEVQKSAMYVSNQYIYCNIYLGLPRIIFKHDS